MSGERPCPVRDCCSPVRAGHLMCLEHWRATPSAMQRAVNATWKRYRHEPAEYLKARAAAIGFHDGKPPAAAAAQQGKLL